MRIPRVLPALLNPPPGNARWLALAAGVLVLSVAIAVVVGAFGWFGLASADTVTHRRVEARVVTGQPCTAGELEVVRFTMDGTEREAGFDGCGHQTDEPVTVTVNPGEAVVHAAEAATGQGRYGQRLDLVLLVMSGVAGAGYGLLVRRGPRGNPLPLGRFTAPQRRR